MKKFYLMALVALASFTFTSCGDDESTPNTNTTVPTFTVAPTAQDAAIYTIPETPIRFGNGRQLYVTSIEVTEDGEICFIGTEERTNRADNPQKYLWYEFNKQGDSFNIIGFGTIIFRIDGNLHILDIRPTDAEALEVTASNYKRTEASDVQTRNLCRTWEIQRYRIRITTDSGTEGGTAWKNGICDLKELIDWAKNEHGIEIDDNLGDKQVVTGIKFTTNGTFDINYARTQDVDHGSWSWGNGAENGTFILNYLWDDEDMGNDFLGGKATVKFNADETCRLTLLAKADISNNVRIEFDLK